MFVSDDAMDEIRAREDRGRRASHISRYRWMSRKHKGEMRKELSWFLMLAAET